MIAHLDRRRPSCYRLASAGAWLYALCAVLSTSALAADDSDRIVVLITSKGSYRVAADAAIERFRAAGAECELVIMPARDAQARQETLKRLSETTSSLIVTGGAATTEQVLKAVPQTPVVFLMMPNALDAGFLGERSPYRDRVAGVTSDIAPDQQVDWIQRTRPGCKRIAVLCSARSERTAAALEAAGRARGIKITPIRAKGDQFPAAIDALNAEKCDGVIMVPDSQVYNSSTVQRLLLWGVRQKRSVWTFSDKVVKAGALAGAFCDPAQVGSQAAEIALQIRQGKNPQSINLRYPREFGSAVNLHTASMIGVKFRDGVLASQVKKFGDP